MLHTDNAPLGRERPTLARRHILAVAGSALAIGATVPALVSAAAVAPAPVAASVDPVVCLYQQWRKAVAETDTARDALIAMFDEESTTGMHHPNHKEIIERECECSVVEDAIQDAIKDTPAPTLAGALCKAIIGHRLFARSDSHDAEFAISAFLDFERLLVGMGIEVEPTTAALQASVNGGAA